MEKKRIFVAMWSQSSAMEFMDEVFHSLIERKIYCKCNRGSYIIETHGTITRFCNSDRLVYYYIDGIRADALFGREPYKSYLRDRLAPGAPYDVGMGLVDYICKVEEEVANSERTKKVYITTASPFRTSDVYQEALRRYFDYISGNVELAKLAEAKRQADEERYVQIDNFLTKELWTKMNPYKKPAPIIPEIKTVYFNNPVTVVIWTDGTKSIVRCQEGDVYDPEKGLAMAITKKLYGNKGRYYDIFKKWIPGYGEE